MVTPESVRVAQQILTEHWDERVKLDVLEVISDYQNAPNTLVRCAVTSSGRPHIPPSVVVKRANVHPESLHREAAGLVFLGTQMPSLSLVPHCYGFHADPAILVMEDLQAGQDELVGNILFGQDASRAEEALLLFNRALGTIHSCSAGASAAYYRICAHYHVREQSRHRIHSLLDDLADLQSVFESVRLPISPHGVHEIQRALNELRDPGPFFTFTHGDATPANAFHTSSGTRLFDLEASDFRHALLDGSFARLRYIYSVWAREIPRAIQQQMVVAYREALLPGIPEAADDSCFNHALASGCAAWLAGLCALIPAVIDQDKKWGRSTNRQRIMAGLRHFAVMNEEIDVYPALADAARTLEHHLQQLWPEPHRIMRPYPAFEQ